MYTLPDHLHQRRFRRIYLSTIRQSQPLVGQDAARQAHDRHATSNKHSIDQ